MHIVLKRKELPCILRQAELRGPSLEETGNLELQSLIACLQTKFIRLCYFHVSRAPRACYECQ